MDKNIARLLGYVKASKYRIEILRKINTGTFTPTEIANSTKINKGHVSRSLNELTEKKLVECANEEARKGRIYLISNLGKKIINEL
jgi:DNA-binding HxlR family transcriptional regulator